MRRHLHIGSRLAWIVAWTLALAAPVVYLAWPNDLTWWVAPLLIVPLMALIVWRAEAHDASADIAGGDGPWAPPSDHGGGL